MAGRGYSIFDTGIGRCGIVVAESLFLRADHALRVGDVISRKRGKGQAEQGDKQKNGPHVKGSVT